MMTFGGDGIRHADAKKSALQGDVLQGSMTANQDFHVDVMSASGRLDAVETYLD
jgi:hypothetical protein